MARSPKPLMVSNWGLSPHVHPCSSTTASLWSCFFPSPSNFILVSQGHTGCFWGPQLGRAEGLPWTQPRSFWVNPLILDQRREDWGGGGGEGGYQPGAWRGIAEASALSTECFQDAIRMHQERIPSLWNKPDRERQILHGIAESLICGIFYF